MYEIGTSPFFLGIIPGSATNEGDVDVTTATMLPRQPDDQKEVEFSPYKPQTTPGAVPEEEQLTTTNPTVEFEDETVKPTYSDHTTEEPEYEEIDEYEPEYPDPETVTPRYRDPDLVAPTHPLPTEWRYPESTQPKYPESAEPSHTVSEPLKPIYPIPSTVDTPVEQWYPDSRYPDPDPVEPRYNNPEPVQPAIMPPHSRPQHPQIVVVDEDEDLDVNGKKKTTTPKKESANEHIS